MDTTLVLTPAWWIAAGLRAAYTALAVALPIVPQLVAGTVTPAYAGSVVGLAALASLVTSLAGLPELKGESIPL